MDKIYYSYNDCIEDCKVLLPKIKQYDPEAIVSIARGGLILGHLLSEALELRKIYSINSIHYDNMEKLNSFDISNIPNLSNFKKVILVDDIVDSGETMVEIMKILTKRYPNCEFKIVTIYYKKDATIRPDFSVREANSWIEFFWEVDLKD
jgi:xanthine phosphoribosyltransferase